MPLIMVQPFKQTANTAKTVTPSKSQVSQGPVVDTVRRPALDILEGSEGATESPQWMMKK